MGQRLSLELRLYLLQDLIRVRRKESEPSTGESGCKLVCKVVKRMDRQGILGTLLICDNFSLVTLCRKRRR